MTQLVEQLIEIYRGEQALITFTFDPAQNITGWTLMFTVTRAPNLETKLLGPLSTSIADPISGIFSVTLTEEQTDLFPGDYVFDVWRTDEGFEEVKAIGAFVVIGDSRVPPV